MDENRVFGILLALVLVITVGVLLLCAIYYPLSFFTMFVVGGVMLLSFLFFFVVGELDG